MATLPRLKTLAGGRPRGAAFASGQWDRAQARQRWAVNKGLAVSCKTLDAADISANDDLMRPGGTDGPDQHRQRLAEAGGLGVFDVPDTANECLRSGARARVQAGMSHAGGACAGNSCASPSLVVWGDQVTACCAA